MVDATEGVLGIEWIEGKSVRKLLPGGEEEEDASLDSQDDEFIEGDVDPLKDFEISVGMSSGITHFFCIVLILADQLMKKIGTEIAKMHLADVIHSDLTTSNMMLRRPNSDLVRLMKPSSLSRLNHIARFSSTSAYLISPPWSKTRQSIYMFSKGRSRLPILIRNQCSNPY